MSTHAPITLSSLEQTTAQLKTTLCRQICDSIDAYFGVLQVQLGLVNADVPQSPSLPEDNDGPLDLVFRQEAEAKVLDLSSNQRTNSVAAKSEAKFLSSAVNGDGILRPLPLRPSISSLPMTSAISLPPLELVPKAVTSRQQQTTSVPSQKVCKKRKNPTQPVAQQNSAPIGTSSEAPKVQIKEEFIEEEVAASLTPPQQPENAQLNTSTRPASNSRQPITESTDEPVKTESLPTHPLDPSQTEPKQPDPSPLKNSSNSGAPSKRPRLSFSSSSSTDKTRPEAAAVPNVRQQMTDSSTNTFTTEYINCFIKSCSRIFENRIALDRHLLQDHQLEPYQCPVYRCGRGFRVKNALKDHLTVDHCQTQDWLCAVCIKPFPSYQVLCRHTFQEHQSGKYVCSECSQYSGAYRIEVLRHWETVHGRSGLPKGQQEVAATVVVVGGNSGRVLISREPAA